MNGLLSALFSRVFVKMHWSDMQSKGIENRTIFLICVCVFVDLLDCNEPKQTLLR